MSESKSADVRHVELELEDFAPNTGPGVQTSPSSSVQLPPIPWKIFALSVFLAISGLTLVILGCVDKVRKSDPGNGLSFWLTGGLVFIPGAFYTVKLITAWRSSDPEERMQILGDVPT